MPATPPPGWYNDPDGPELRWWNGATWTSHRAPKVGPQAPPGSRPPAPPVFQGRDPLFWVCLASIAAMVIGAVGPWGTALGGVVSRGGLDGDGVIVLIAAVLAAVGVLRVHGDEKGTLPLSAVAGLVAGATAVIDIADLQSRGPLVGTGWGIWASAIGSGALIVAAIAWARNVKL